MENTRFKVSGNHINELSENIPSNIFALNELIKNSYDACSSFCEIQIDRSECQVIIKDDGKGLGEDSIEELFYISKSTKKFGHLNPCQGQNRRVQGSKGLGFLSAFRFGSQVRWDTHNSGTRYIFSVDKQDLINLPELTTYTIEVETEKSIGVGTIITIESTPELIEDLLTYFSDSGNSLKLVGAFSDYNFAVKLVLPDSEYKTSDIPSLKNINPQEQLFYITYDSDSDEILFFRNGYLQNSVSYIPRSTNYRLTLELIIYNLESYGRRRISPFFYNPENTAITPLVFINDNLFNNYSIFNPDLVRSKRTSSALPQMVGYIKVYSESEDFEFNSDRTNFVENPTTKKLENDLRDLNERIQEEGSKLKETAKRQSNDITGPACPNESAVSQGQPFWQPVIELTTKAQKITVPSEPIDLTQYVEAVVDSKGEEVPKSSLEIEINGERSETHMIGSVSVPSEKKVVFRFDDPGVGPVISSLGLSFKEKRASISGRDESKSLFYILESEADYCVEITGVSTLVNQITRAHKYYPDYTYLVACSLRTIFELSNQAIERRRNIIFTHTFEGKNRHGPESKIVQVIHFLKNNNPILTELRNVLGMNYHTLNNLLDKATFRENFVKSNIGAHSGDQNFTESDIEGIAMIAGYYAVFCDALIYKIRDEFFENSIVDDIQ